MLRVGLASVSCYLQSLLKNNHPLPFSYMLTTRGNPVKRLGDDSVRCFAAFYAGRLCITPQYLNRILKAMSGRTVSGWINFTLVNEITRRLEDTCDTMQQITADLNFSDQATLTKFYKRETGYSLTEYRKRLKNHCAYAN